MNTILSNTKIIHSEAPTWTLSRDWAAICWALGELQGSRAISPLYTCWQNRGFPSARLSNRFFAESWVWSDLDFAKHSATARIPVQREMISTIITVKIEPYSYFLGYKCFTGSITTNPW